MTELITITDAADLSAADIGRAFELDADGCLAPPTGPGFGVEVDAAAIDEKVLNELPPELQAELRRGIRLAEMAQKKQPAGGNRKRRRVVTGGRLDFVDHIVLPQPA